MSNKLLVVVPIRPRPKQRPEFNSYTKRAYTPKATLEYERVIGEYAKATMKSKAFDRIPLDVPIALNLVMVFAPTKSWTKKKKEQALNQEIYPMQSNQADVDNGQKAVLDALNKIVYEDDRVVVDSRVRKIYGEKDQVIIMIRKVEVGEKIGNDINI